MKELAFGIFIVLLVASCESGSKTNGSKNKADSSKAQATLSAVPGFTLTGLDQKTAEDQIDYFDTMRYEDDEPEIVSVRLDSRIVRQMYDLICSEHGDGIRMYFAAERSVAPFLKTSIIFVSTKYDPTTVAGKSDHRDYYKHDPNDTLFQKLIAGLKTFKPILRNDNCDGAALLYEKSSASSAECEPNDPHHLKVSDAEDMVMNFRDKKQANETTSEWFDLDMFLAFTKNNYYDGIRIYYSTRQPGQKLAGRDCFVITTTKARSGDPKKHYDDFTCNTKNPFFYGFKSSTSDKFTDPKDNGQLCPFNCN